MGDELEDAFSLFDAGDSDAEEELRPNEQSDGTGVLEVDGMPPGTALVTEVDDGAEEGMGEWTHVSADEIQLSSSKEGGDDEDSGDDVFDERPGRFPTFAPTLLPPSGGATNNDTMAVIRGSPDLAKLSVEALRKRARSGRPLPRHLVPAWASLAEYMMDSVPASCEELEIVAQLQLAKKLHQLVSLALERQWEPAESTAITVVETAWKQLIRKGWRRRCWRDAFCVGLLVLGFKGLAAAAVMAEDTNELQAEARSRSIVGQARERVQEEVRVRVELEAQTMQRLDMCLIMGGPLEPTHAMVVHLEPLFRERALREMGEGGGEGEGKGEGEVGSGAGTNAGAGGKGKGAEEGEEGEAALRGLAKRKREQKRKHRPYCTLPPPGHTRYSWLGGTGAATNTGPENEAEAGAHTGAYVRTVPSSAVREHSSGGGGSRLPCGHTPFTWDGGWAAGRRVVEEKGGGGAGAREGQVAGTEVDCDGDSDWLFPSSLGALALAAASSADAESKHAAGGTQKKCSGPPLIPHVSTGADGDGDAGAGVGGPVRFVDGCDQCLSVADFRARFLQPKLPVLLRGCPLLRSPESAQLWRDLRFLLVNFGHRTVPVELGRTQEAGTFRECAMSLGAFVRRFMLPSNKAFNRARASAQAGTEVGVGAVEDGAAEDEPAYGARASEVGYVAQHCLFDQLPALRDHFHVPRYAFAKPDATGPTNVNAWLGTRGTVTSLHFDSYDNLLAQVCGFKYVRLYAPAETPKLYVKGFSSTDTSTSTSTDVAAQGNISQVKVEEPDLEAYPLFAQARFEEVILAPGDVLFIPKDHWHYVRSLTPSFSINFWF